MGLLSPIGSEIDSLGYLILESVAGLYVIILKFIFTPIFEIKLHGKKFLGIKIISFSKPDFPDSVGVERSVANKKLR